MIILISQPGVSKLSVSDNHLEMLGKNIIDICHKFHLVGSLDQLPVGHTHVKIICDYNVQVLQLICTFQRGLMLPEHGSHRRSTLKLPVVRKDVCHAQFAHSFENRRKKCS